MPKTRVIIVLGLLVALLPVLGFPRSWEVFFQVLAGLSIVVLSVWSTIDRKLKLQAKAQQRQARKAVSPEELDTISHTPGVVPPVTPDYGKRITDFYPKTGQPGRRLTDIKPTLEPLSNEEEPGI
jgi:hypothetical protein